MMRAAEIYRIRHAEIFVAAGALGMGAYLLRPAVSMGSPGYRGLLDMASEPMWGAIFALNGLMHLLSLYINGARWWTPFVRLAACVFSAAIYAAFVAGFWAITPDTTAVPSYSVWGVAMSSSCAWRAHRDAVLSMRRYHAGLV